jgi:hypothetical protein
MERRELFPILAATALPAAAQHEHHKVALVSSADYKLQSFTASQNRILDILADIIIPDDPRSPGASAARVSQYFDLIAHHQPAYRGQIDSGLAAFEELAQKEFGKPLNALDRASLTKLLEAASRNEGKPGTPAERFFEFLKFQTIEGYRFSHIGQMKWIGYKPHEYGTLYPDNALPAE